MALFGGSKSSSNQTNTEYNFANYGGSGSGGGNPANLANVTVGSGKGSVANLTIETSDYGAIDGAMKLSELALKQGATAYTEGLQAFAGTTDKVLARAMNIAEAQQKPEGSQLLDSIKQIAIGLAIAFVVAKYAKN